MGIPTNVVDAASAIKDGALGVISTIQIGDVIVSALTGLQWPKEKNVTRRPVQAGFDVTMGAVETPADLVLDIVLANPNFAPEALATAALTGDLAGFTATWREKKAQIEQYFTDNEVLDGTTHIAPFTSHIITKIEPRFDSEENWDCWIATITLTPFNNRQAEADLGVAGALTAAASAVGSL